MNVLVVGNILKDVYLNIDSRTENFESDKDGIKWLNIGFNASEHYYFSRESSLGGAAISLEVLEKMGINSRIAGSSLDFIQNSKLDTSSTTYRYILVSDGQASYFTPSEHKTTDFDAPSEAYDYVYIDRSSNLTAKATKKLLTYLEISKKTKLILYIKDFNNPNLNSLIKKANLVFYEENSQNRLSYLKDFDQQKIIQVSENQISYLDIIENLSPSRIDISTHLSIYSTAAATILGGFILGYSVENSLKLARINLENSKLNSALTLSELQRLSENSNPAEDLELTAMNLVLEPKGILAADESGGSIKRKFSQLNIKDTYENRRDYRNIFLSTPNLEDYINGVILFDETARQLADNGQNFVNYLIGRRIIPGIKVDQGLEKFNNSIETYTKGLDGLSNRLSEYYSMGLRFAKWRAAFEIHLSDKGTLLTPTDKAIEKNCEILAEYAKKCQIAKIVPIVEPEVVYDGYYPLKTNEKVTSHILDILFEKLKIANVNLRACILKVNMVMPGRQYESQSSPEEVGKTTAEVLKKHVPKDLAGVVFLSGGQTPTQATKNLLEIQKQGSFPWPVTFSFARALQDPALFAWKGNNSNLDLAKKAFLERLTANTNKK